MSHLTADAPAIALGAGVGLAAGFYARQALSRSTVLIASDQDAGQPVATWLLAIVGGVSGALIGARFGMQVRLPAYLYLVAIAPALSAVDAATRTLPNRILLPAYAATSALLGFASWRHSDATAFWRGALAGILLFAVFLAIALLAPAGSLGWGDVKLVGLLGLLTGYLGCGTVWLAMTAAFVAAALFVVARRLVRREAGAERGRTVPMGPALLLGTLVAVIVS